MLVYAHRGLHRDAPENSLAAIEAAAHAGFDGVEVDARRCLTGELVLVHDPEPNGTPVRHQSFGRLRDSVPGLTTLRNAAIRCGELGLGLDVEVKEPGIAVESICVVRHWVPRLHVTSFLECALRDASFLLPRESLGRLLWPDGSARSGAESLRFMATSFLSPAGLVCPPFEAWARMPLAFVPSRSVVWCPPAGMGGISRLRAAGVAMAITDHAEHAGS